MRRPHVYERSVPRARRDPCREPDGDRLHAARTVLRALPGLTAGAEAAGLAALADLLEAVRREAERVAGEDPRTPCGDPPGPPRDRDEPE